MEASDEVPSFVNAVLGFAGGGDSRYRRALYGDGSNVGGSVKTGDMTKTIADGPDAMGTRDQDCFWIEVSLHVIQSGSVSRGSTTCRTAHYELW